MIWPRIDQKTCLKCIVSANLRPLVVENRLKDDVLETDLDAIEQSIHEVGAENVVCIMSTTSCFSPRGCDAVIDIAKLCQRYDIPHIVNNAYGVQSAFICREITAALRRGRVDAMIQSTDKNFMVPVGGSIVAAPSKHPQLAQAVAKSYPGRASASAHLDLFITLLQLGRDGWIKARASAC